MGLFMKCENKSYLVLGILFLSLLVPLVLGTYQYPIKFNSTENLSLSEINRENKVFTNITQTDKNCLVDAINPALNEPPQLYLPNHQLSYAKMNFENISALNYTKNIETEFSDSVRSSPNGSIYVYQKFYVRMSQYVNNVTVLIQDINNKTYFTDENSWEVAIVNCSNDEVGTPNPNETLGKVQKPHPIKIYPEWVTFDFKSSDNGPVFLNISNTKHIFENGIDKYWFAFRVKIPPDDTDNGGGPKFLYFNLDEGGVDDIGEGEIFCQSPDFIFDNYTLNNVVNITEEQGILQRGGVSSFIEQFDGDEYIITNESDKVRFITDFNLEDLRNYEGTYHDLYDEALGFLGFFGLIDWYLNHYKKLFKVEISLALNISYPENIEDGTLYAWNFEQPIIVGWQNISHFFDLKNNNSELMTYEIRDPNEKIEFLKWIDSNDNNKLRFMFEYTGNGNGSFNVTIDKLTIEIGEIDPLAEIQKYDPLIENLEHPNNLIVENDTNMGQGNYKLSTILENDNDYLNLQADSNNLTAEFNFNILNEFNNSLWDANFYDWLIKYPFPYLPKMEVRISSNTSFQNQADLTHAILEVYKGDMDTGPFEAIFENYVWIPISENKTYAHTNEKTIITEIDTSFTWIFLRLLNESADNLFRMRLRYNSDTIEGFNVSIDEVSLYIYIRNLISSDITSKIGFGVDEDDTTPEYLGMEVNNITVEDDELQKGSWESLIENGFAEGGYYEFDITSIWPFVQFDVNGTYEIYKIKPKIEFLSGFATEYMAGNQYFSVNVTGDNGTVISNLKIYFQVMNPSDQVMDQFPVITDENGIASVNLDLKETGRGYYIRVQCAEENVYAVSESSSTKFRVINGVTIFLDTMIMLSPLFIAIILGISGYMVLRHRKLERLRDKWKTDAMILEDLLKLSYIMIIHKEVGVAIYSQQISSEKLDPDLISGFLHAISSFKREFKKNGISKQARGFEMNYYDFHINLTDGDYVRIALIAEQQPSEYLKEQQIQFTKEFEDRYQKLIISFKGDTSVFNGADKLVEKYFNISLMYPLQTNQNKESDDLDKLEKDLVELANEIQKEKEYFFFSDLLSFGMVGRDEPRNKVISTIINLKKENYLRSFQF